MKIADFLEGRDVERQAVTRYINRHPEIFAGHTTKNGKELDLDDVAVDALSKVYPFIEPTLLVNGVPHEEHKAALTELVKSQKKVEVLQEQLMVKTEALAERDVKVALLEASAAEKARLQAAIEQAATTEAKLRQECSDAADLAAKERAAREATEARLNALPKWKQRLIGWKGV